MWQSIALWLCSFPSKSAHFIFPSSSQINQVAAIHEKMIFKYLLISDMNERLKTMFSGTYVTYYWFYTNRQEAKKTTKIQNCYGGEIGKVEKIIF